MSHSVQEVVWNWQNNSQGPQETQVPLASLRRQAGLQAGVLSALGFVLFLWLSRTTLATVVWGLAGLVLILGLLIPTAYRPVHKFGQWLGQMVGTILTKILLIPLYFLLFFPGALILKIQGRDPMHRKYRDPKYTFWIRRQRQPTEDSYLRQFLLEDRSATKELRLIDQPGGKSTEVPG